MDPMTALMLASIGTTGALGLGQGIANTIANNPEQKLVKQQLDELNRKKAAGNLGLTGEQQQLMSQSLNAPVQNAAAQGRARAEQIAASMGGSSGADLSRLRQEQGRTVAMGAQNAAQQVAAANLAAKQQQLDEINRLTAMKSGLRSDDYNSIFSGLSQMAGAAGGMAGVPKAMGSTTSTLDRQLGVDPMMRAPLQQQSMGELMRGRFSPDELQQILSVYPQLYSVLGGA